MLSAKWFIHYVFLIHILNVESQHLGLPIPFIVACFGEDIVVLWQLFAIFEPRYFRDGVSINENSKLCRL